MDTTQTKYRIFDKTEVLVTCIFCLCALLIKYHWNRRRLYYFSSKVHGPPAWPIIGSALDFAGTTEDILQNAMKLLSQYKSPLRAWLGQRLFYGIAQPKHLEIVLNSPHALTKESLYRFTEPVLGKGIVIAPVPVWKRNRKIILTTFNQKILNTFVPVYVEQANILVNKLKDYVGKGFIDVLPLISPCSLDIICETAMGVKVNAQLGQSDYMTWIENCLEVIYIRMFRLWYHSDIIFNMSHHSKELKETAAKIQNFTSGIIKKKKKGYRQQKLTISASQQAPKGDLPIKRSAFLDYIVELSEEGQHFTDDQIRDEVNTLTFTGSDSTSTTDSFVLLLLGMHQDIQETVYDELNSIFDGSDRPVACEDLPRMTYLERVIKETMRLFPVAPLIARAITEDIVLDSSCTLPKGSSAVLGIIHTHRDPELWDDPLCFDPDRFLPENVAKRHPYSYIPFSAGPRNCIGPKYAMMSMKIVIATILRTFKLHSKYKYVSDIKVKADLLIKAVDGYSVAFDYRCAPKIEPCTYNN